jgi:aromatic ring-opening dioxygenase catalytic subunit (LigB family)
MPMLPTFFIPHGGGPCFDINGPEPYQSGIDELGKWLSHLGAAIRARPRAILMVTAHWVTSEFTVSTNPKPSMLYDYTGFPPHTYELRYDAPGAPEVADEVVRLVEDTGMRIRTDDIRGFDHGTFVPLRKIYPNADIPVVQFSIKQTLNPREHIEIGRVLRPLRDQGVLILGSGMSFHNFAGFMKVQGAKDSVEFDDWLTEAVEDEPEMRNSKLVAWDRVPAGRKAHPEEDHLIPLMVISGAAGEERGQRVFNGPVLGTTVSAYQFGN